MSMKIALKQFNLDVAQCDGLIATAHRVDAAGQFIFSAQDRKQITITAFLNLFIAWEAFLEASIPLMMTGKKTINGSRPRKFVSPKTLEKANRILLHTNTKFFDFSNHDFVRTVITNYFDQGFPFQPHLSGLHSDLGDMKTIRNACAHISSSTQNALEVLALRVFGAPHVGIGVYDLLTAIDPKSPIGDTVFNSYKNRVAVAVDLIAKG